MLFGTLFFEPLVRPTLGAENSEKCFSCKIMRLKLFGKIRARAAFTCHRISLGVGKYEPMLFYVIDLSLAVEKYERALLLRAVDKI